MQRAGRAERKESAERAGRTESAEKTVRGRGAERAGRAGGAVAAEGRRPARTEGERVGRGEIQASKHTDIAANIIENF